MLGDDVELPGQPGGSPALPGPHSVPMQHEQRCIDSAQGTFVTQPQRMSPAARAARSLSLPPSFPPSVSLLPPQPQGTKRKSKGGRRANAALIGAFHAAEKQLETARGSGDARKVSTSVESPALWCPPRRGLAFASEGSSTNATALRLLVFVITPFFFATNHKVEEMETLKANLGGMQAYQTYASTCRPPHASICRPAQSPSRLCRVFAADFEVRIIAVVQCYTRARGALHMCTRPPLWVGEGG